MKRLPRGTDEIAEMLVHVARSARGDDTGTALTAAQWTGLRFFARANKESRTPSAFASFQATTRGTASQTIKSLEEKRLLVRRRSEHDGRSFQFEITETGRGMLRRDPLRNLIAALDRLDAPAREALVRALAPLAADLAEMRGSPAFGTCGDCAHYGTRSDGGAYCACVAADLAPEEIGQLCANFALRLPEDAIENERGDAT